MNIRKTKNLNKNKSSDVDLTYLYAYIDQAHSRDRELWRGFLSCVLPTVLSCENDIIDQIISDSLTDSIDDLIGVDVGPTQNSSMRQISSYIAKAIGIHPEFALASFYNCDYIANMPTKIYKLNYRPAKKQAYLLQEEHMIEDWLKSFSKIQTDKEFLNLIESLKEHLINA